MPIETDFPALVNHKFEISCLIANSRFSCIDIAENFDQTIEDYLKYFGDLRRHGTQKNRLTKKDLLS